MGTARNSLTHSSNVRHSPQSSLLGNSFSFAQAFLGIIQTQPAGQVIMEVPYLAYRLDYYRWQGIRNVGFRVVCAGEPPNLDPVKK